MLFCWLTEQVNSSVGSTTACNLLDQFHTIRYLGGFHLRVPTDPMAICLSLSAG